MRGYWLSLLGTRRWIKTFILVATILTGSAIIGLSVFNKQNIPRADEEELPGFDYVEYQTSNIMDGQLENLNYDTPLSQVNNYSYSNEDTLNLRVRLAGLGYFRAPSKDDRQAILAQTGALSDDPDDNTRLIALVNYLEIQPDGSYAWLDQFNRGNFACPEDGGGTGMVNPAESVAHAQGVMTCPNEVQAAQEKKDKSEYWANVNTNYDIWDGFYQRARVKFNSYARNEGKDLEPFLYKQYWSAADLDYLYNNIFPGSVLKTQRNEPQFVLERQYLQGVLKAYKTVSTYKSQGLKDATIDVAAFFFPPARGGKGLAALAELAAGSSRVIRPYAIGYVMFKTTADSISMPIVDGALRGGSINLTRAYSLASKVTIDKLLTDRVGQQIAKQGPIALDYLMRSRFVPAGKLTSEVAAQKLASTFYISTKELAKRFERDLDRCPIGVYQRSTGKVFIDETNAFNLFIRKSWTTSELDVLHLHIHEYLHSIAFQAFRDYYSKKLGYHPLEEGFTEFFAVRITRELASGTYWAGSYKVETQFVEGLYGKLINETYRNAAGRITFKQAEQAVLNSFMKSYYSQDSAAFNEFVGIFIGKSNPYYTTIKVNLKGDVAKYITTKLEKRDTAGLKKFIDSLQITKNR